MIPWKVLIVLISISLWWFSRKTHDNTFRLNGYENYQNHGICDPHLKWLYWMWISSIIKGVYGHKIFRNQIKFSIAHSLFFPCMGNIGILFSLTIFHKYVKETWQVAINFVNFTKQHNSDSVTSRVIILQQHTKQLLSYCINMYVKYCCTVHHITVPSLWIMFQSYRQQCIYRTMIFTVPWHRCRSVTFESSVLSAFSVWVMTLFCLQV